MRYNVTAAGIGDATGQPFTLGAVLERDEAVLTDDVAAASYGLPVLVYRGAAYGPGDVPGVEIVASARLVPAEDVARMRAAGWRVDVLTWCDYCGERMGEAEARAGAPLVIHARCARDARAALAGTDGGAPAQGEYAAWLRRILGDSSERGATHGDA